MKKKAIILLACTAALMAVSCQKEAMKEAETTPTGEGMTISAVSEGIGAETKAAMVYKYDVIWKTGDKICVKNSEKSVEFTLTGGEETTKGTFSSKESISGEVEGFYPASVANLIWPAEQQNNQVPPMYCKKTLTSTQNQTFSFASLGSVLQLNFNSTTADIVLKSIEVKADEAMSGAFTIENGQAKVSQPEGDKPGITLDLGEGVKLGTSTKKFNMAVPAGEYHGLSIVFTATDGKKCTINAKKDKAIEIVFNTVNTFAVSGEFKADIPAGALPGVFSVSGDKKVYFSQGNLQATIDATGAPTAWKFAANQYDYLGAGGANKTIGNTAGDVDLFGWSTASTTYGISTSTSHSDYSGDFVDWGKAYCEKNKIAEGTWCTLTKDEWTYLINEYGKENIRKGKHKYGVTVCDKANCLILAPDDFEGTIAASYDAAAWATAEAAGFVCLPAAGYRDGSNVYRVGGRGLCWSSTRRDNLSACYVSFDGHYVNPGNYDTRRYGCSVRLISEAK